MKERVLPNTRFAGAVLGMLWLACVSGLGYIWLQTLSAF